METIVESIMKLTGAINQRNQVIWWHPVFWLITVLSIAVKLTMAFVGGFIITWDELMACDYSCNPFEPADRTIDEINSEQVRKVVSAWRLWLEHYNQKPVIMVSYDREDASYTLHKGIGTQYQTYLAAKHAVSKMLEELKSPPPPPPPPPIIEK